MAPTRMTVKQAAAHATVCAAVVYGWCASGRLPHYRLGLKGGKIVIALEDLEALVASLKVTATPPVATPRRPSEPLKHLHIG